MNAPSALSIASTREARSSSSSFRQRVGLWLLGGFVLLLGLVLIGGLTRLTGSGLSIVEWRPVTGILPPLTEADWLRELAKYRESPEYRLVNAGMSLEAFQRIYWFEYVHRLYGRLLGLYLFLPLLFLALRRRLETKLLLHVLALVLLGGAQGGIGWYMVASGLGELPYVSALRLTLHLTMALALAGLLLWTALDWLYEGPIRSFSSRSSRISFVLSMMATVTVTSGGLVAGTHAGRAYNSFPLMAGKLVPEGLLLLEPWWRNVFENVLTIQFQHRALALSVSFAALLFALSLLRRGPKALRLPSMAVLLMAIAQPTLGVLTLLFYVPIDLAAAHQMGGFLFVASLVWLSHDTARIGVEASLR